MLHCVLTVNIQGTRGKEHAWGLQAGGASRGCALDGPAAAAFGQATWDSRLQSLSTEHSMSAKETSATAIQVVCESSSISSRPTDGLHTTSACTAFMQPCGCKKR